MTTDDPAGEAIIKEYDYKGKDKLKVAGDILEIEKSKGLISSGDSVRMYVNADDPLDSDTYKSELEDGMKGLDLNISVLEIGQHPAPPDPVPPPIQDQPAPGKDKKDDKPASLIPAVRVTPTHLHLRNLQRMGTRPTKDRQHPRGRHTQMTLPLRLLPTLRLRIHLLRPSKEKSLLPKLPAKIRLRRLLRMQKTKTSLRLPHLPNLLSREMTSRP